MSLYDGVPYHGSRKEWEEAGGRKIGPMAWMQIATLGESGKIFAVIYTGNSHVRGFGELAKTTVGALRNMLKMTEAWLVVKFKGHAATVGVNQMGALQPISPISPISPIIPITPITPISPVTPNDFHPANKSNSSSKSANKSNPFSQSANKPNPPSQSAIKPRSSRAASVPTPKHELKIPTTTVDRPKRATDMHEMLWGSHFMRNPNYHSEFPENNNYREFEAGRKVDDGDNSYCFNTNFKSEAKNFVANAPMFRGKPAAPEAPKKKGAIDRLYF